METDHIYMISSSPCASNSCYNHTKISLKLLGLAWTSSTLQWLLWWQQELFLPQDVEEAEPDLICTISCRNYSGFPLPWSPQTTSHLWLLPDTGKWVQQKQLSCRGKCEALSQGKGGCSNYRREERGQGALSQMLHPRANLVVGLDSSVNGSGEFVQELFTIIEYDRSKFFMILWGATLVLR